MRFGRVALAALVSLGVGAGASAQTLAEINGPKELPPASFTGQQFVDSRGCVFLRAGVGGEVTWVPRVRNDRKVLCGYPPTFAAAEAAPTAAEADVAAASRPEDATPGCPDRAPFGTSAVLEDGRKVLKCSPNRPAAEAAAPVQAAAAPPPAAKPAAKPATPAATAPVAAAATKPVKARPVAAAPARTNPPAPAPVARAAAPVKIACPVSFPKPRRFAFKDGGTVVLCTRADGSLAEARVPIYPPGADVGLPLRAPTAVADLPRGRTVRPAETTLSARSAATVGPDGAEPEMPKPPKGYRLAWDDDRLNVKRGRGTAEGQAAQDRVWTRDVPAELVADQPAARKAPGAKDPGVTVSTKAEAGPARYVQVGTFAQPQNVAGSVRRLQKLGLPVAKARITQGGQPMQIVLAGPFGSAGEAQTALGLARKAGFGDAFIR